LDRAQRVAALSRYQTRLPSRVRAHGQDPLEDASTKTRKHGKPDPRISGIPDPVRVAVFDGPSDGQSDGPSDGRSGGPLDSPFGQSLWAVPLDSPFGQFLWRSLDGPSATVALTAVSRRPLGRSLGCRVFDCGPSATSPGRALGQSLGRSLG